MYLWSVSQEEGQTESTLRFSKSERKRGLPLFLFPFSNQGLALFSTVSKRNLLYEKEKEIVVFGICVCVCTHASFTPQLTTLIEKRLRITMTSTVASMASTSAFVSSKTTTTMRKGKRGAQKKSTFAPPPPRVVSDKEEDYINSITVRDDARPLMDNDGDKNEEESASSSSPSPSSSLLRRRFAASVCAVSVSVMMGGGGFLGEDINTNNVANAATINLLPPDLEKRLEEEEAASYARIRKLETEIIAEENRIRAGEMKKVTAVNDELARVREQEMKKVDILNAEADSFKAQQERIEANSRDAVARGEALCVTPSGIDIVGITELLALIGATASGIRARQQKIIVDELNEKLRAINQSLTARSKRNPTGMGASLGYAGAQMAGTPVDSPMSASMSELASGSKDEAAIKNDGDDASKGGKKTDFAVGPEDSMDDSEYDETRVNLKKGRQLLREKSYQEAISSFEKALALSRMNGDQIKMRRAFRGLGATKKAMGELSDAIKYMEEVLDISKAIKDYTGDMDAVGSIADMYTELGDLEKAGEYYDMYLSKINDASVDYDD